MGVEKISLRYSENNSIDLADLKESFVDIGDFINVDNCLYQWIERMGFWKRINRGEDVYCLRTYLSEKCQSQVKDRYLKEVSDYMRHLPKLNRQFVLQEKMINVLNGVVALETMQLKKHRKEFYFDYVYKIIFSANADIKKASHFMKFVASSMGIKQDEELKFQYLMQLLAYVLSPSFEGKKAIFICGESGLGKSCLLHLLEHVVSRFTSVPLRCLGDRFRLAMMNVAHQNIVHEVSESIVRDTDIFKKLVSCESVVIEEKGIAPMQCVIPTKLIFSVNDLPEFPIELLDRSLRNRMAVFIFSGEVSEAEVDSELTNKLISEKDIIFSVAIRSLGQLAKNGYKFLKIKDSEALLDMHFNRIDTLDAFFKECCILAENQKVHYRVLYRSYKLYCKDNLCDKVAENDFKKYFLKKPSVTSVRFRKDGANLWGFDGIGINERYESED